MHAFHIPKKTAGRQFFKRFVKSDAAVYPLVALAVPVTTAVAYFATYNFGATDVQWDRNRRHYRWDKGIDGGMNKYEHSLRTTQTIRDAQKYFFHDLRPGLPDHIDQAPVNVPMYTVTHKPSFGLTVPAPSKAEKLAATSTNPSSSLAQDMEVCFIG